jgi:hypothetical protein
MGTCGSRSSAYVSNDAISVVNSITTDEDKFVGPPPSTGVPKAPSWKISSQKTMSMSSDLSCKDSGKFTKPSSNSAMPDTAIDIDRMEAIINGSHKQPVGDVLKTSPESDFLIEEEDCSQRRDNEVVTVVSRAGSKSVVSFGKLAVNLSTDRSEKSIDSRNGDDNESSSRVISNISSLTSASPVPSKSAEDFDEYFIELPKVERGDKRDLRKSRSLFGNSFNSLSSQLSSPSKKVLPVDGKTYMHEEIMEESIHW